MEYVYGEVPPEPATVTLPVEAPPVATTCTVFVPTVSPVNVVDPPLVVIVCVTPLRVTKYGGVPPVTVAVTEPFEPPKQLTELCANETLKPALKVTPIGVTK